MNWGVPEWDSTYPQPRELTPREWAWEFRRRDPQYRLDWIHHAYRARFDPTKAAVEPAFMQSNARMHIGPADLSLAQSEAAVVIHLGQPPAAQFAEATRSLPKSQHRSRLRKNEYPFYLRVLDARDAGATPTEIAKFFETTMPNLSPETLRMRVINWLRRASRMTQWEYSVIANLPAGRSSRKACKSN